MAEGGRESSRDRSLNQIQTIDVGSSDDETPQSVPNIRIINNPDPPRRRRPPPLVLPPIRIDGSESFWGVWRSEDDWANDDNDDEFNEALARSMEPEEPLPPSITRYTKEINADRKDMDAIRLEFANTLRQGYENESIHYEDPYSASATNRQSPRAARRSPRLVASDVPYDLDPHFQKYRCQICYS